MTGRPEGRIEHRIYKQLDTIFSIWQCHAQPQRGRSQMMSVESGREGGYPYSDAVREVA